MMYYTTYEKNNANNLEQSGQLTDKTLVFEVTPNQLRKAYDLLESFLKTNAYNKLCTYNGFEKASYFVAVNLYPRFVEQAVAELPERQTTQEHYIDTANIRKFISDKTIKIPKQTKEYAHTVKKFMSLSEKIDEYVLKSKTSESFEKIINYDTGEFVVRVENISIVFSMKQFFGIQVFVRGEEVSSYLVRSSGATIKDLRYEISQAYNGMVDSGESVPYAKVLLVIANNI